MIRKYRRIILILFMFTSTVMHATDDVLKFNFEYFGVSDGLPSNEVNRISQDSLNFIWCATNNGLSRFDGYKFSTFRSDYTNTDFFPSNIIRDMEDCGNEKLCLLSSYDALFFDKTRCDVDMIGGEFMETTLKPKVFIPIRDSLFMIGGEGGLVTYDLAFRRFSEMLECEGVPVKYVREIYKDSKENIWISVWKGGIYIIPGGQDKIRKFVKTGIPDNISVTKFYEDDTGNLFFGTWGDGLFCLRNGANVIYYTFPKTDPHHLDKNIIYDISVDNKGYVWCGSPDGLRIFRLAYDVLTPVKYINADTEIEEKLHEVKAVFKDNDGNMWIADYGSGLVMASYVQEGIEEIDPRRAGSTFSAVTAIHKQGNILWIGIRGQKFIRYDLESGKILDDKELLGKLHKDCNAVIGFVSIPEKNLLFISTRYYGVYMFNLDENGNVVKIKHFNTFEKGVRSAFTNAATKDADNNIWIGSNSGLTVLKAGEKRYTKYVPYELNKMIGHCTVETVYIDSKGYVWIGSANSGLYKAKYDMAACKVCEIRCYNVAGKSISNDKIQTIFEDSEGRIWAGTNGGGVNLYNPEADSFGIVHDMDLFPSDQIFAMAEDENGQMWISTGKGISCYDPDEGDGWLWSIGMDAGLKNLSFIKNSVYTEPGLIIFGGYDGLSLIYSDKIRQTGGAIVPSIVDVQILDKPLGLLSDERRSEITETLPPYTKHITVGHRDLSIRFNFVAPVFRNEEQVKYAYRLSGLDKDWNYVNSSQRTVTYSYLKPGSYRFEVIAGNASGKWTSVPAYIDVSVKPAPWLTLGAKLAYLFVFLASAFCVFVILRNRERLRQALKIEQMERLKADEVNNAKLMFFTNVSHELFTPITVMSCSLEKLIEKEPRNYALHKIIRSNLNRLMRLLQQIMEFRKAESSNLKLKVSEMDIVPFVKKICDENFSPLVVDKNIRLIFSSSHEHLRGYADPDKLDKILYNLISNAYKYNRNDGKVFVSVSEDNSGSERFAVISVKDTGYGIGQDRLKDLFKRFYEGDYRHFNTKGTGIGLSLTKDLVDLHRGTIDVNSIEGEGTLFTVRFPIDKDSYDPDQIDIGVADSMEILSHPEPELEFSSQSDAVQPSVYTLLIVEDNEDLLLVMKSILEPRYKVLLAREGKEALNILKNESVSLVITDYAMPEMNGLALCRKMRSDISLSHIPVVMLSAKTAKENRLRAFDAGVDAFISKPFEVNLLIAQVDGMLANRDKLYKKFRSGENIEPDLIISTDKDKQFVEKTIRLIENHISDPNFGIEEFNSEMNMSNSTLYRKIKGVTGMSPKEFIRNVRFKYACRLLLEKTTNIADVAFMVGFSDAKYFSLSFKKEFGMTPSQYIAEHRKKQE